MQSKTARSPWTSQSFSKADFFEKVQACGGIALIGVESPLLREKTRGKSNALLGIDGRVSTAPAHCGADCTHCRRLGPSFALIAHFERFFVSSFSPDDWLDLSEILPKLAYWSWKTTDNTLGCTGHWNLLGPLPLLAQSSWGTVLGGSSISFTSFLRQEEKSHAITMHWNCVWRCSFPGKTSCGFTEASFWKQERSRRC